MSPVILHATTVALNQNAVLVTGRSGSGKSALGLELMAFGCELVADDRTIVTRRGDDLFVSCPPAIRNMIEARGIGLLWADARQEAQLRLVVTLDTVTQERLPLPQETEILAVRVPLVHKVETASFAAAILQYLKSGKRLA
jgi:HPr kinase/phosphorylase